VETSDKALRVVLADDHHFFREGLRGVLAADGMTVVGEAVDGAEAVTLTRELTPDVVVIDLNMPNSPGVDAVRQIVASSPTVAVVVLTVSADGADALEVLEAGAGSYLLKDTRTDELAGCIRQAAGGQTVLSRQVAQTLTSRAQKNLLDNGAAEHARTDLPALTTRETEVLLLLVDGADNATIGRELSISPHTVKQYMTNIFEKLEVSSRVQAAVYAVRAGLA
jgi:two-component system, NarL family, nitrate/nitrite response regulator NarL